MVVRITSIKQERDIPVARYYRDGDSYVADLGMCWEEPFGLLEDAGAQFEEIPTCEMDNIDWSKFTCFE